MHRVKNSRKLKKIQKANIFFQRLSATLQTNRLVLQSEKLVFTRIFRGQINPRAMSLATSFAFLESELLGTSPTQKEKEQSLVVNNKAVPSPATAPKICKQQALNKRRKCGLMLLLLRSFRSSEVAIRVVSTRRESDGSLMRLQSSRRKKVLVSK